MVFLCLKGVGSRYWGVTFAGGCRSGGFVWRESALDNVINDVNSDVITFWISGPKSIPSNCLMMGDGSLPNFALLKTKGL